MNKLKAQGTVSFCISKNNVNTYEDTSCRSREKEFYSSKCKTFGVVEVTTCAQLKDVLSTDNPLEFGVYKLENDIGKKIYDK